MTAIRCWLGRHKIAILSSARGILVQGCDRCGKRRTIILSDYGRPLERGKWA